MSKKNLNVLSLFLTVLTSISCWGANDWDDLSFKLQLEKNLIQESRNIVEAVIPKTHYYIALSVTLDAPPQNKNTTASTGELYKVYSEEELKNLAQKSDRIYLDKLGGWTYVAQATQGQSENLTKQRTIQKIDATLVHDESLDAQKIEGIKKTLEFLYKSYTKKINLQLDKQKIYIEPVKEVTQLSTKDWVQLLKEPITYFVIALMGLLGYLTTNSKRIKIEKEKVAVMSTSAQQQASQGAESAASAVKPTDVHDSERASHLNSAQMATQDQKVKELILKVENIYQTNMHDLKSLVKEFLAEESLQANCALTFLASSLNVETLKKLTSLLSLEERAKWKKNLISDFDVDKIGIAQQHLDKSISQFYLEECDSSDKELKEMLKLLSPRDAAQILKKNSKLSAFLFNNLSTIQLTRLVALLDSEALSGALKESILYSESDNRDVINALKVEIQELKSKNENVVNPFVEKSFDLIKDIPLMKEEAIFNAVAMTGQAEILTKMSVENLPVNLILDLPSSFLLAVLNKFKLEKRVEIILSRSGQDREKLLACYGATGKNREIIDLEIQTMGLNQIKMKSIDKNKDLFWTEFVRAVRSYYRSFAEEPTEIEEIRSKWVSDFITKNRGSDVSSRAS